MIRVTMSIALLVFGTVGSHAATLVVANKSDATVDLVDPATGESRATLPTGDGPHEAIASPDGKFVVVANYGVRGAPGSSLSVIDVAAAEVVRTIGLGEHTRPHGLAWLAGGQVAVTTEGSKHLLVVDPGAGKILAAIETAQEVSHMVAVTPDGKRAFVANIGSGNMTAIDLEAGKKIKDVATGEGAEGIAVTPDGAEVWVTNRGADTISVVDTAGLEVLATLESPSFPIRIAFTPDGKRALVSCARSGDVAVFDVARREEVVRKKLDIAPVKDEAERLFGNFGDSPTPIGLVVAPDGKRAYVAATRADAVVVVDPVTLNVVGLIKAGREPDGMTWAR
jgi:YVTN family beta-propeller protein